MLTQSRSGLLTVGVVLAIYFSSSGIEALRIGLNRAYRVKERRPWYVLRLESIAYVLVGSLAVLALTFLVVLGPLIWAGVVDYAPALHRLDILVTWSRFMITAVVMTAALVVAHLWLPAERHTIRQILPGLVFTLLSSFAFAFAFGIYLANFARNYASTYAGLASVMIAILFLYTLASIFVYGGELNATLCRLEKRAKREEREKTASR